MKKRIIIATVFVVLMVIMGCVSFNTQESSWQENGVNLSMSRIMVSSFGTSFYVSAKIKLQVAGQDQILEKELVDNKWSFSNKAIADAALISVRILELFASLANCYQASDRDAQFEALKEKYSTDLKALKSYKSSDKTAEMLWFILSGEAKTEEIESFIKKNREALFSDIIGLEEVAEANEGSYFVFSLDEQLKKYHLVYTGVKMEGFDEQLVANIKFGLVDGEWTKVLNYDGYIRAIMTLRAMAVVDKALQSENVSLESLRQVPNQIYMGAGQLTQGQLAQLEKFDRQLRAIETLEMSKALCKRFVKDYAQSLK